MSNSTTGFECNYQGNLGIGIVLEKHPSVSAYLSRFKYVEKIDRGVSGVGKHRIRQNGNDFFLRIASGEKYEAIKREFEYLKTLSKAGLPVHACVDLSRSSDNARVFTLLSWIPGEDAKHVLPKFSSAEQYAVGFKAGDILRRIHAASESSAQNWYDRYFAVMEQHLEAICRERAFYDGPELVLRYLKENRELLNTRPVCHLHEDYHPGNLIVNNGEVWVIDWHTVYFDNLGDPWYEFHCLRTEYPAFASGQIDGYFQNDVSTESLRLFAFYYSASTISSILWLKEYAPGESTRMKDLHRQVLQMFKGMQDPHPAWYGMVWYGRPY